MLASEPELFLDELNAICERTNKFDDIKTVSPLVCEFTEKIIHSRLTKSSVDELEKEMANDCKPLDEAVKNLAEKIWPAYEDGIGYAEKNEIKNQATADLISFNSRELNANNLCIQFCMLPRLIKWLWNDDPVKHRNFIEKYASIDELNQSKPVKVSFDLDALEKELKILERIKKIKAWYSLQQLKSFYVIYNPRVYEEHKNIFRNNFPINQMQMDVRSNALDNALNPTVHQTFYEKGFSPHDYRDYMQRVYHHVRQRIMPIKPTTDTSDSLVKTNVSKIEFYAYSYDPVTSELKIDGYKPIKFQTTSNTAILLRHLMPTKGKQLSYLHVYNTILMDDAGPGIKKLGNNEVRKVESLIRSINDRLPDSIPDFLIGQDHKYKLDHKLVIISSSYKSGKS